MRLKELRLEKNLTQSELAKAINTSQRNIGRWENELNEPTSSFVMQLATYLEVSADYLLGLEDDFGVRTATAPNTGNENYSAEERQLINDYQKLNSRSKKYLQDTIKMLLESASGSEKNRRNI